MAANKVRLHTSTTLPSSSIISNCVFISFACFIHIIGVIISNKKYVSYNIVVRLSMSVYIDNRIYCVN